ncbi:MAG: hypothetical protein AAGA65_22240 [Actinomycetota bacterium]
MSGIADELTAAIDDLERTARLWRWGASATGAILLAIGAGTAEGIAGSAGDAVLSNPPAPVTEQCIEVNAAFRLSIVSDQLSRPEPTYDVVLGLDGHHLYGGAPHDYLDEILVDMQESLGSIGLRVNRIEQARMGGLIAEVTTSYRLDPVDLARAIEHGLGGDTSAEVLREGERVELVEIPAEGD